MNQATYTAHEYLTAVDGPHIFEWFEDVEKAMQEGTEEAREVASRNGLTGDNGGRFPRIVWEVVWPPM